MMRTSTLTSGTATTPERPPRPDDHVCIRCQARTPARWLELYRGWDRHRPDDGLCKACHDAEFWEGRRIEALRVRCGERKAAVTPHRKWREYSPRRFRGARLGGLSMALQARARAWLSDDSAWLLMLTGAVGTGKTHAVWAIADTFGVRQARERRRRLWSGLPGERSGGVHVVTVSDFVEDLRPGNESLLDSIDLGEGVGHGGGSPALLCLDDLGTEKPSEFVLEQITIVIDQRYREEWRTIITSNLTLEQIARRYGDRIASRLSTGLVVKLTGPDRRRA